jgi:hypothetical protein
LLELRGSQVEADRHEDPHAQNEIGVPADEVG